MAIDGMSLLKGATGISITGGTAAVFESDGLKVSNGIHVVDTTVSDLTLCPHATFKNKPHSLQSDGSYSKGKREVNFTVPKVLASGQTSFQVSRNQFEIHPEMTDAEILELRLMTCQLIMDSELDNFFKYGSTK